MFEINVLFCLVGTEIFLKNAVCCSCTLNKMHINPISSQYWASFFAAIYTAICNIKFWSLVFISATEHNNHSEELSL